MKKIILAIAVCSILPTIAVAEDRKMENTHTSASENDMTKGKHMQNTHTSKSDIDMKTGKHMRMGDNPFSAHDKAKAEKAKSQTSKGYSVIKYEK